MEEVMEMVNKFGIDTVLLAVLVMVSTGLAKIPIKRLTNKMALKGYDFNKYITLLPFLFGILYASLGTYFFYCPGYLWNDETLTMALTGASLSLAIFAVCEKFFQKKQISNNVPPASANPLPEADAKHYIIKR